MGNFKVGIFGMVTPETHLISQPDPARIESNIVGIAQAMVDTLKGKGCDVILLVSHLGVNDDRRVADSVSGIHAIIGGHDHIPLFDALSITNASGWTTQITQADAHYRYLGKLQLEVDGGSVTMLKNELMPLDTSIPEEPNVKAVVDQLIEGIEAIYGPVYSQAVASVAEELPEVARNLTADGNHDTPVGNLVADALRATTGTEVAIQAGGSIAMRLYPGPTLPADLFRVVGYGFNTDNGLGFRVASLKMPGAGLVAGLEFGLSTIELHDEYLIQVSGMSYTYDPTLPIGSRVTGVMVNGQPLDPERIYSVGLNEFAIAFINLLGIPHSDVRIYDSLSEFQALTAYVTGRQPIRSPVEGRIRAARGSSGVSMSGDNGTLVVTCHPNPSADGTTITIALASPVHTRVEIFDLLGRSLAVPQDGILPSGTHALPLDTDALPEGAYLCRITAGDHVRSIRLVSR
jgi:2',3'-cyclic-nucleotide 2'-phosphodiesterase (5'-nucleotidase family)